MVDWTILRDQLFRVAQQQFHRRHTGVKQFSRSLERRRNLFCREMRPTYSRDERLRLVTELFLMSMVRSYTKACERFERVDIIYYIRPQEIYHTVARKRVKVSEILFL